MDIVRIGILGFAHGHVGMYCTRWAQQPELGAKVIAGWDHDSGRAQSNCANFGLEQASSVWELVNRTDIDAVVIGAETSMHADMVEQAAAAGKAIVLQKPLALTMEQADRIVAAVRDNAVPFTLAWQMRVDPHNLKAKSLLESGEFGRVFMIRRRHGLPTQLMPGLRQAVACQAGAQSRHIRGRRRSPHRLHLLAAGYARECHRRNGHAPESLYSK